MLSYLNDPAIKEKFQLRFAAHRAADEVIQGTGFEPEENRGCFVGCTLDNYDHSQFPVQLGWPEWLARLADTIFEGIPKAEAPQFGTDLLAAVPVGKDLEPVRRLVAIERHTRQIERLNDNTEPYAKQCRAALQNAIDYCKQSIVGFESDSAADSAYWAARSAARSAADSADSAYSAADSAAYSARSAALSAAYSARSAAYSAAYSAADSAAYSARSAALSAADSARSAALSAADSARVSEYRIERDTLLSILRAL